MNQVILSTAAEVETVPAIDRTAAARFEGDFGRFAAGRASGGEHPEPRFRALLVRCRCASAVIAVSVVPEHWSTSAIASTDRIRIADSPSPRTAIGATRRLRDSTFGVKKLLAHGIRKIDFAVRACDEKIGEGGGHCDRAFIGALFQAWLDERGTGISPSGRLKRTTSRVLPLDDSSGMKHACRNNTYRFDYSLYREPGMWQHANDLLRTEKSMDKRR